MPPAEANAQPSPSPIAGEGGGGGPDDATLVARLTLEQKVRLLTGADAWSLNGEPAVGLRPMVLSDGPAGVRGTGFDAAHPSSSLPAPVGLAATWDEELVERIATALGEEARGRGVDVLLAPTVNIIRTPLSGRAFECFSEDPVLSARMAVAYVRGLQRAGVGAAVKHYVGNDSETDRRTYDVRVSERVLRELYLAPFEACVREAGVALVMAAYNSVNGATMTANRELLHDLLKTEWGFKGVVVSDWSATQSAAPSALAGLDLVMPGPGGPWGDVLLSAVRNGFVPAGEIDDKVSRLLRLARRLGALNGSRPPAVERLLIDPRLLREVTARSFVLLQNRDQMLPLDGARLRTVALIGPNALAPQTQGGGSVRVLPFVSPTLADSLRRALGPDSELSIYQGCSTWNTVPTPADGVLRDPVSGNSGVRLEVRDVNGAIVSESHFAGSVLTWWDRLPKAVHVAGSYFVLRARYQAPVDGPHLIGAAGVGLLRIAVDGSPLAEARTLPPREVVEAFSRPPELRVPVELRAGQLAEITLEYRPDLRGRESSFVSVRLGITPALDDDLLLRQAVEGAAKADAAVVVVGSADGTESEGYDRRGLALAGRQDELVARVAAANPNTIVVVNAGAPVLMPWADRVPAIIQVWLPGQAFGEALADCLFGVVEPAGRLPVSLPNSEADSPVLHAFPVAGELPYAEGLMVGYRGYDRDGTEPRFSFGHGMGYTEWTYESMTVPESLTARRDLRVVVRIRNTGMRQGREVVQLYLEGPDDDPGRPLRVLAAFASIAAEGGASAEARITIPARAFERFDERSRRWVWQPGIYKVLAGRSSRDLRLSSAVLVQRLVESGE
jgi:beta-glucosidase